MGILCFGVSHHSAPLRLLEPLSFDSGRMSDFLHSLVEGGDAREAVGISTCNRTEFYVEAADPIRSRDALAQRLVATVGCKPALPRDHGYAASDEGAVRHLFRVACGVDSLIVGEHQILGQIREALDLARDTRTAGRVLEKMFVKGIQVGRRAHHETRIGRGNVSVASIAASIARKVFSDLGRRRALIVGAGQTARLAAIHLRSDGVSSMMVANRTPERAEAFAKEFGGEAIALSDIAGAFPKVDIVVCATGSPDHLVTRPMLADRRVRRRGSPLVLLDLSLPRNIDPAAGDLDDVFLYGIQDLESVAEENKIERQAEVGEVEKIVDEEVRTFLKWLERSDADLLAMAIRQNVETIRRRRLEAIGPECSPEVSERLDKFTESLLRSIFHDLTSNVRGMDPKSEEGNREWQLARRLFRVRPEEM